MTKACAKDQGQGGGSGDIDRGRYRSQLDGVSSSPTVDGTGRWVPQRVNSSGIGLSTRGRFGICASSHTVLKMVRVTFSIFR